MEPPVYPDKSDCCGSGCSPCIYDIYEKQLEKYNRFLKDGSQEQKATTKNCLNETKYSSFLLISVKKLTKDTNLYKFRHENCDDCTIHFRAGQHLLIKSKHDDSGDNFSRAYTLLPEENKNCFTVIIKLYEEGKMSNVFRKMEIGAKTFWRGPYGEFELTDKFKHVLMICQGTGIAPFYAILNEQLNNLDCETFFKLFYCCRDYYFHEEIFRMKSFWNFTYEIFQNNQHDDAKYGEIIHRRRLEQNDIDNYFLELNSRGIMQGIQVLVCGSESFSKEMRSVLLKYDQRCTIFVF